MKKILLNEDNQNVRETTVDILALAGYAVLTAESGKAGIQVAIAARPDLISCIS